MPTPTAQQVEARLGALRARLDELGGGGVEVVAVTKAFPADVVVAAAAAGCRAIGENYARELLSKVPALDALETGITPAVHFIGHVQSNKVRLLGRTVDVWETVDRESLADELGRRVPGARVMIQVNMTGEEAKAGCSPDDAAGLVEHAVAQGLVVEGLMTIGPTDLERTRTELAFRSLRRLADDLDLTSCSMGMSGDYEIAVAHGATHIRIGTLLFGERLTAR